MSCPQGLSFFWRLCPAPFPPVTVSGYILLGVTWRISLFIESPVIPKKKLTSSRISLLWSNRFFIVSTFPYSQGFPGSLVGKESACNAGDLGLIPGLGRYPGDGIGSPLQYSCLENSMDRGAWWATVREVAKSRIQLSDKHFSILTEVKVLKMAACFCFLF